MGAYGCVWVRWDTGGMGNTKTRQAGYIQGLTGQDLGAMAGEISPDMMFCGYRQKWSRMGEDGYISVQMGEDECISNEESKNKTKRDTNG